MLIDYNRTEFALRTHRDVHILHLTRQYHVVEREIDGKLRVRESHDDRQAAIESACEAEGVLPIKAKDDDED